MKLYCVGYETPYEHRQDWFGSKKYALKFFNEGKEDTEYFRHISPPSIHEIPTDKSGLIGWLNHHCNNGESAL